MIVMRFLQHLFLSVRQGPNQMQFMKSLNFITVIAEEKSIRKASERLAITPSALNRRLLAIEDELNCPLFERMASGVRLNTAGELFLHHIKRQQIDLERVRSQIADLEGMRRGHVNLVSSHYAVANVLAEEMAEYRHAYPRVTFSVQTCERDMAEYQLSQLNADLAMTVGPVISSAVKILASLSLAPVAIMRPDHPLSQKSSIRLYECAEFPIIMPEKQDHITSLIHLARTATGVNLNVVGTYDNHAFRDQYLQHEDAIGFHLPLSYSSSMKTGLITKPFAQSDIPPTMVCLLQLSNRVLSVAAAKFAEQLVARLERQFQGVN